MSQSYEIVFYGKLEAGFTEEVTKQHVAQLFKTDVSQVERMFTGKRVVIRNKLDFETAQKYILAMAKRGAQCQIEVMGSPGVPVSEDSVDTDETSAQSNVQEAVSAATDTQAPVSAPASAQTESPQQEASSAIASQGASPSAGRAMEVASKTGLNLAGDEVDTILADVHLGLDPVGIRLSEEHEEKAPDMPGIDALSIAPAGADLADKKEDVPVSVPDISHLSLK